LFLRRKLDLLANWVRANICGYRCRLRRPAGGQIDTTGASRHDIARFGAEATGLCPRQCDLMIVAGRVVSEDCAGLCSVDLAADAGAWRCILMGPQVPSGGVFDTYAGSGI